VSVKPASELKKGRRADLGDIFFHSAWEANYARYLNFLQAHGQIEKWEYAPDTFWFDAIKRGVRSYKPDFKIWERGKVHYDEVKGWMDPQSKTKLKRMKKYHPAVDVRLVGRREYTGIKNSVGKLIAGWE
jgi:hypothetical protein